MIEEMLNDEFMKKILLLAFVGILGIGCQKDVVFSKFKTIPKKGWDMNEPVKFMPNITDTLQAYDMQLVVRHTDQYAYQNLWLFVDVKHNSTILFSDTIEGMLANQRGKWLGDGMRTYELPLLYLENIKFPHQGEYEVVIKQGMRENVLQGIIDIGLKVIKHGKK